MALKGPFGFAAGRLVGSEAYAVIDAVHVDKGGMASAHVSIYATPPVDLVLMEPILNEATKIVEQTKVTQRDRGPVVEHYTCGGIDANSLPAFTAAYQQLTSIDDRFKDMVAA